MANPDDLATTFLRSKYNPSHINFDYFSWTGWTDWTVRPVGQRLMCQVESAILVDMAHKKDSERDADLRRLDSAIAMVEEVLEAPMPGGDVAPQVLKMARDSRLQAADRLVSLLERRSKLLGLDTPEQKPTEANGNGTLAELERKLALVAPGKAS
jgi:hypothetical protein